MTPDWLEVCIDTSQAGQEPLSAWLTALGMGGLVLEDGEDFLAFLRENRQCWDYVEQELLDAFQGVSRVKFYVTDDAQGLARLAEVEAGLPALRDRTPQPMGPLTLRTAQLREEDWANGWKQHYRPMEVGRRLYIVPQWEREQPVPPGRLPVYLNPGLIFGTGAHSTTQLCLEALEELVTPGLRMVDLGCGSGILSIAALALGAAQAVGCDIDSKAAGVAGENAACNGFGPDRLQVFCGDVLTDGALRRRLGGGFDLAAANIVADVILALAPMAGQFLRPDGIFLCSGILEERGGEVEKALADNGLQLLQTRARGGWAAYAARLSARR